MRPATTSTTPPGQGEGITIGELAETLLALCDSSARIHSTAERERPEKCELQAVICDNSKTHDTLGWQPGFPLRQGLEETVEWMRKNLAHYKAGLYNV